VVDPWVLAPV